MTFVHFYTFFTPNFPIHLGIRYAQARLFTYLFSKNLSHAQTLKLDRGPRIQGNQSQDQIKLFLEQKEHKSNANFYSKWQLQGR